MKIRNTIYLLSLLVISCSTTKNKSQPLIGKTIIKSFPTKKSLFDETSENQIFGTVETPPMISGCETEKGRNLKICYLVKIKEILNTNLKYPEVAKKNKIQGRTIVKYIINKKGEISDISIKGNEYLIDESMRLIKSLPIVIPAKQRGRPTEYEINTTIMFELKNQ